MRFCYNETVQHLFFGKVLRNDLNLDKNVYKEGAEYQLDEAGAAFDQGKRMSNEEIAANVKKRYSNFEMKKPLTEEEFEQKFKSALKGVQDYKKKMLSDKNLDKQGIPRPQQNRVVH